MPEHHAADLSDLSEQKLHPIEVEDTQILLFREGDVVHAVGGTCPHAGAPLAEGIQDVARVICPWHKATFCLRTGGKLEPPALDDLPRYRARIDGQRVLVTLPEEEPPKQPELPVDGQTFVIVGGGAAGAVAAQTLREAGFGGRVIMLDRINRVPYDRTVLSKYHLSGQPGAEKSPLQSQSFYREHRIERRTAEVERLDPATKTIRCVGGETLHYDAALVATGGSPTIPSLPGGDLGNVFLLRTIEHANAILAQAERSQRAVVLGASFIGMEVAASLRERGLDVTVVGKENAPFERQLGARIGEAFVHLHRKKGMVFRLGQQVQALEGGDTVQHVVLGNGERLPADLVVAGFGIKPSTAFLHGVPLNEDGSITVDEQLQAAPGLYAAGDIARYSYHDSPLRVEHWRVAEQHGRVAALNMMGQKLQYDAVPVFWTIQYLKRLDYIGHAEDWDEIVVHGDLEKPEFLAYYVKDGRVIAAVGLDRDQDTAALIVLFERQRDWTPEALGHQPSALLA